MNSGGQTFTISGDLATLQSNCTQTAGTCTDTSRLLNVNQQYTGASGTVVHIQSSGTGALLKVTDNTATARDVLNIADGGATTFRNQTDSTTAFQIQNSAGTSNLFVADTSNTKVGIGQTPSAGGAALQVTGAITATTGNINATAGTIQTNAVDRIDNSGNLVNIGTITSGLINGQTISSSANFTGTLAVQGASLTIGNPGSVIGSLNLANSTSSRQVILQGLNPSGTGNATVQIPTIAGGSQTPSVSTLWLTVPASAAA